MIRLLHTSDWHVGRKIRGRSRAGEQRAVLAEIAELARLHEVDVVLVAGDLFESAAPTPESEEIVYRALLDLGEAAPHVAIIAGNHDSARRLRAVAPLLALGHIAVVTEPTRADDGGVVRLDIRGDQLVLAMLPFVSQRGIVRAGDLMAGAAFEHAARYAERLRLLIDSLTTDFAADSVNVVMNHSFVRGSERGGGERMAHLVDEYAVTSQSFPPSANYVALGHLHRPQKVPGPTSIHYCGSPLQLAFGESEEPKQVNLVEASPGQPAQVTPLRLRSGRGLRSVAGSLDELDDLEIDDDPWLSVTVLGPRIADVSERVRAILGDGVVDVLVESPTGPPDVEGRRLTGRSPRELFAEYLSDRGVDDARLVALFDELLEGHGTPR